MQREIGYKYFQGTNLNPLNDVSSVPSIDNTSSLDNAVKKVDLLSNLWEYGKTEVSLARYIPGTTKPSRQGQIASIEEKRAYADDTYNDKRNLEFIIKLAANRYTNFSTMQVVLPVYFQKNTNEAAKLANTVITANNFSLAGLKKLLLIDTQTILQFYHLIIQCLYAIMPLQF